MAIISVYQHGVRLGTPGSNNEPPPRGKVGGWSSQSARRNTKFLQSVVIEDLTGVGFAFTLTVRDCPPTHDHWRKLREAYFHRLKRAGALRIHWVTEWQRRGVPHLHGVVYFPEPEDTRQGTYQAIRQHKAVKDSWLPIAKIYGAQEVGQHINLINDTLGWLRYMAKHVARGVWHYQRSPENVPAEWQNKTGRMWGHWGEWSTRDAMKFEVSREDGFRYRRLIRSWAIADARGSKISNGRHIRASRSMLKCNTRPLSEVRGVGQWCPLEVSLELLGFLARSGAEVDQVE